MSNASHLTQWRDALWKIGSRKQEAGSRKQEAGSRKQEAGICCAIARWTKRPALSTGLFSANAMSAAGCLEAVNKVGELNVTVLSPGAPSVRVKRRGVISVACVLSLALVTSIYVPLACAQKTAPLPPDKTSPPPGAAEPARVTDILSCIEQTAAVIEGTVTDISYDFTDKEGPRTLVTLSVASVLAGEAPDVVTLRLLGGPLPDGRFLSVSDMDSFLLDETYIIFLRNTAWRLSPILNGQSYKVALVDGGEVLTDSGGRIVSDVTPNGVELKTPDSASTGSALNRQSFVHKLQREIIDLQVAPSGSYYGRPREDIPWNRPPPTPASNNSPNKDVQNLLERLKSSGDSRLPMGNNIHNGSAP